MVTPKQGDIIYISFSPTKGHEQSGRRPALVLSNTVYNKTSGLILCAPITSSQKKYPFEVLLTTKKIQGVILADQIRTFDHTTRQWDYVESVSKTTLSRTLTLLEKLLSTT